MPKQARNGNKAIKVLGQGQEMRKNERNTQKQAFEFFFQMKKALQLVAGSLIFYS